jgi:lipopolysaccharide transport system permease protein
MSPFRIFGSVYRHRYLLFLWVRREMRVRYAGSVSGIFWAVSLPLATVALYFVFFSLILKIKIPQIAGASGYFFYLLAGLLPWMSVSEASSRAGSCLVEQGHLLQRMVFPMDILPASVIIVSLVPQLVGTIVYLAMLAAQGLLHASAIVMLPAIFICQIIMMTGLAYCFAAAGAVFRDIIQALTVLLQFWFYMTPILYPWELIPQNFAWIMNFNPLAALIKAYQCAFLGLPLAWQDWGLLAVWTCVVGISGMIFYALFRPSLVDQL